MKYRVVILYLVMNYKLANKALNTDLKPAQFFVFFKVQQSYLLLRNLGIGIARHADAGYEKAIEVAKKKGVKVPMINNE